MFTEAFFTVAKILNQTKCPSSIKWINRCIFNTCNAPCICIYVYVVCMDIYVYIYTWENISDWRNHIKVFSQECRYIYIYHIFIHLIYIHEDYSSIWKRDSAICKNMSKVREHYLVWNQSDKERQTLNSYKTQNGDYQELGHEGHWTC